MIPCSVVKSPFCISFIFSRTTALNAVKNMQSFKNLIIFVWFLQVRDVDSCELQHGSYAKQSLSVNPLNHSLLFFSGSFFLFLLNLFTVCVIVYP